MEKKPKLEVTHTARGFAKTEFIDRYGLPCSIQKSSLGTENAIWFGVDDAKPMILAFHVNGGIPDGWVDYPIPDEVLLHTRMHLTQQQVKDLLPILKKFAKTGEID